MVVQNNPSDFSIFMVIGNTLNSLLFVSCGCLSFSMLLIASNIPCIYGA